MSPEGFKLIKIPNATDAWENWVLFLVSFPSRQIPPEANGVLFFFGGVKIPSLRRYLDVLGSRAVLSCSPDNLMNWQKRHRLLTFATKKKHQPFPIAGFLMVLLSEVSNTQCIVYSSLGGAGKYEWSGNCSDFPVKFKPSLDVLMVILYFLPPFQSIFSNFISPKSKKTNP